MTPNSRQSAGAAIATEHPSLLFLSCSAALTTAFLDLLLSMLFDRSGFPQFTALAAPLAATTAVILVCFSAGFSVLRRLLRLQSASLAAALSGLVWAALLMASAAGLITYKTLLEPEKFFQAGVIVLIALANSLGIYVLVSKSGVKETSLAALFWAAPLAAGVCLVGLWWVKVVSALWSTAAAVLVTAGLLFLIVRNSAGRRRWGRRLIPLLTVAILLSPLTIEQWADGSQTSSAAGASPHSPPRVILITVDTLRADAVSAYSKSPARPTPAIDSLATDGLLFEQAISPAPYTLPSIASLMTGLPPQVHMTNSQDARLPIQLQTLAEYFAQAGYLTAAVGRNGFLSRERQFDQGFAEFNFFPRSSGGETFGALVLRAAALLLSSPSTPHFLQDLLLNAVADRASSSDLTNLAIRWIEGHREEDFFLWIHYLDPHDPYTPPSGFLPRDSPAQNIGNRFTGKMLNDVRGGFLVPTLQEREWIRTLYQGEAAYVDHEIGRLLETLKRLKIYRDSLIVLTSDHGEEFWEHSGVGHGHSLHQELLEVPLIFKLPYSHHSGSRCSQPISTLEIMPTLLDLCGIDSDEPFFWNRSLSRFWADLPIMPPKPIYSSMLLFYENRQAVLFSEFKYIRFLSTGREQLFDLAGDPGENYSLDRSRPEEIQQGRRLLHEMQIAANEVRARYSLTEPDLMEVDAETKRRLKALGYIN